MSFILYPIISCPVLFLSYPTLPYPILILSLSYPYPYPILSYPILSKDPVRGGGEVSEEQAGARGRTAANIYTYSGERKRGDEKRGDRTSKQKYTTNKHKQT